MQEYLLLLAGFPLLLAGAWITVSGDGALALGLRVSRLTVGLTVLAIGTSAPELIVTLASVWQGATDMALGNVLGSYLANTLLVLGLCRPAHPACAGEDHAQAGDPRRSPRNSGACRGDDQHFRDSLFGRTPLTA